MLRKENRIRLKKEFDQVFKGGSSFYNKKFGVKILKTESNISRLGIIVNKKVSKKAVERNRIKRIIRDFFKNEIENLKLGRDIVIIVFPEELNKKKAEIEKDLAIILNKIKKQ
ncbi:MAG: ribonuclease protein component [Patescibacteria group bacterium]|nr:ribonuclease protein component [Patescibacteria group bacterium]